MPDYKIRALSALTAAMQSAVADDIKTLHDLAVDTVNDAIRNDAHYAVIKAEGEDAGTTAKFTVQVDPTAQTGDGFLIHYRAEKTASGWVPTFVGSEDHSVL